MKLTATSKFHAIARGASKVLKVRCYIKKTDSLSDALSAGTWLEVTDYIDIDSIGLMGTGIELGLGQFSSDSLTFIGLDIDFWQKNVFGSSSKFIEFKMEIQLGLSESDLASDVIYEFSGWLEKKRGYRDLGDEVSVTVYSHDEYGNRRTAEDVVFQPINSDIDGAGTDGVVLQNISGLWVKDANVASFVLKKGIHTLTYEYNGGTQRAKLDDGSFVNLGAGNNTLSNAAVTEKVIVYAIMAQLPATNQTQDIIVTTAGNTLPNVWHQRVWLWRLLERLYSKIGITSNQFDTFDLNTFDGRFITSYFEQPDGATFLGQVKAIAYDATNNVLWIGINDKIYKRSMSTHTYTLVATLTANYSVLRFFTEGVSADFLVALIKNVGAGTFRVIKITISTGSSTEYAITPSSSSTPNTFALSKNDSGSWRWLFYPRSGEIYYINLDTGTETDTLINYTTLEQPTKAGWSDGNAGSYFSWEVQLGVAYLLRVYFSGGSFLSERKLGGASRLAGYDDGAYNASEGRFIATRPPALLSYSHSGDTETTITASLSPYSILYGHASYDPVGAAVYLIKSNTSDWRVLKVKDNVLTEQGQITFTLPDQVSPYIEKYSTTFDGTKSRSLFVGFYTNLLAQYATFSNMYVETQADFEGKKVNDAIRELAIAFNCMVFVSSIKKAYSYRRGDNTGNKVNSGNRVSLTINEAEDGELTIQEMEKIDIIQVSNGTTTWWYDGTTFTAGPYKVFGDEKVLTVTSAFIPDNIVKDIAYYMFQFYKYNRAIVKTPLAMVPLLQYEPFDECVIDFHDAQNMKKMIIGTIVRSEATIQGELSLSVLAAEAAVYDYAIYDLDVYA